MSPSAKLAGFAVVLVVTFVLGLGLGSAAGPIDVGDGGHDGRPVPVHDGHGSP